MTVSELFAAIDAGRAPRIVDVRTADEFAAGHVPGAINMPFNEVGRRAGELTAARDEPLVVYCGHGPRAWIAGGLLRRRGFRYISYMKGHMAAWRRARLREELGPASTRPGLTS
jgi:hydroxyacylglutathione hydrolase